MNVRIKLIAAIVAVLLTGLQLVAWNQVAGNAAHGARFIAAPKVAIPVLPEIKVRPAPGQIHAAVLGSHDLASAMHTNHVMPFYSFAVTPAAATKG